MWWLSPVRLRMYSFSLQVSLGSARCAQDAGGMFPPRTRHVRVCVLGIVRFSQSAGIEMAQKCNVGRRRQHRQVAFLLSWIVRLKVGVVMNLGYV